MVDILLSAELEEFKGNPGEEITLKKRVFSEDDVKLLEVMFTVLSSLKRLGILNKAINENAEFRLKKMAESLSKITSAQIAIHVKRLHDAGLLAKKGKSRKRNRRYCLVAAEETYAFLKIALNFAKILESHKIVLELEGLRAVVEKASERIELSSFGDNFSVSGFRFPKELSVSIRDAQETLRESKKQFAQIINLELLKRLVEKSK